MGYVLGHVALDDGRARLPCINSRRIRLCTVCRIPGVVICQLTSARFPRRDSPLYRGIEGGVSQDTCGPGIPPVVYFNRWYMDRAAVREPRPNSHEPLAKVRLTCGGTCPPATSRRPRRAISLSGFISEPHVKQRAPETTARRRGMGWGGWEASPRQKCFRPDDKQNENRRNTQAASGVRFIARHLRARRKSMDTIRTLKNFSVLSPGKILTGKCRNHEVALGLMK